jgi:ketosteroid isomerase-like protein
MRRLAFAIALAALVAMPATAASEKTDVIATAGQFVKAFNHNDAKAIAAVCTDEASIIDDFPPHVWRGAGACSQWFSSYQADARESGITDGRVTLGIPRHVDVAGNRAYAVFPASFTYKQKGKMVQEIGSRFTLVLVKDQGGWRITAWAWAQN